MIERIRQRQKRNSRKADRGEAAERGVVATSLFAKFCVSRNDLRSGFLPAFTLIEMLIVVALIATLMTIVFRLSAVSTDETARTTTVLRLARIENCLSGYYAAFGNYPPVRLHNTRDIYQKADAHGVQSTGETDENLWGWTKIGDTAEARAWNQVEAACRAQPVGAAFPYPVDDQMQEQIQLSVEALQENMASGRFKNYPQSGSEKYQAVMAGFDGLSGNLGRFSNAKTAVDWRDIQVFKFGLLSFLLPRYQMMMAGNPDLYTYFAQWTSNNMTLSNPLTGDEYKWDDLNEDNEDVLKGTATPEQKAKLANIPSDAVCVRWLPNLEGVCVGTRNLVFYGVQVVRESENGLFSVSADEDASMPAINIYAPNSDSLRDQYILDTVTIVDGWNVEFFYYSPSPHQSYQLWSAGKNRRTFPPWISRAKLSAQANKCAALWMQDDIRGLSR